MLEVFNLLKVFLQVTAHVSGVKDCNCHDFSEIVHSSSGVFHALFLKRTQLNKQT